MDQLYPALTDRLRNQHESIARIISGLTEQQVRNRPDPGKWSIHENIAHLAIYQPVFTQRVRTMASEGHSSFDRYRADDDPNFVAGVKKATEALLQDFVQERQTSYDLITTLSPAQLSHTGTHPVYGTLSIVQWTELFLLHEAHHLLTVFRIASPLPKSS